MVPSARLIGKCAFWVVGLFLATVTVCPTVALFVSTRGTLSAVTSTRFGDAADPQHRRKGHRSAGTHFDQRHFLSRKSGCFQSNGVLTRSERDPVCAGGSRGNRYDACRVKIGDDDTGTRQHVICLVNRLAGDDAREFLTMHAVTVPKKEQNRREGCSLNSTSNPLRHSLHLLEGVAVANGMLRRAAECDSARKRRS